MKVRLIARTQVTEEMFRALIGVGNEMLERETRYAEGSIDSDFLAEFAGRLCYKSFHLPNPATRENKDYLARTLWQENHWSIAEHASFSFLLEDISRSCSHELVRHRHFSFSQVSQRFVNEEDFDIVNPPAIADHGYLKDIRSYINVDQIQQAYMEIVEDLTKAGLPRKQAREAARAVLPNATETSMVMTGNARAWKEFLDKRDSPYADKEMQLLAKSIKKILLEQAPNIFQGFVESDDNES